MKTGLISAVCTPLAEDGTLERAGFTTHLERQHAAGISGLLVGGTMGMMQLQSDAAYADLIDTSVRTMGGKMELLVGVGDASYARTLDRIRLAEKHDIDGLVVLTPYFLKFSQAELIDYYTTIAGVARRPVFVYLLPPLTGVTLDFATVLRIAEAPNIRGIKCSVPWDWTRQLYDMLAGRIRVIPAQPHLVDHLIRLGIEENLDGMYAIAPKLSSSIALAARSGEWDVAARRQGQLSALWRLLTSKYPLLPACTAILQSQGIKGNVAPRPAIPLTPEVREQLLAEPIVKEVLSIEG